MRKPQKKNPSRDTIPLRGKYAGQFFSLDDSRIDCRSNPVYLKQRPDSYVTVTLTVILKNKDCLHK